ncbi:MAG TPA: hypothetical protein VKG43_12520 [Acidimicrobiales bacterium]|nr:hypothetical protein [Acidimicrobiales bacterium]
MPSDTYQNVPHPKVADRRAHQPVKVKEQFRATRPVDRFNAWLAVKITDAVGTMWCAYAFAGIALISLPDAVRNGRAAIVSWIAQTFLQLVLLSIIMVGQNIQAEAADKRSEEAYENVNVILDETRQLQEHLAAQDAVIERIIEAITSRRES